MKKLLFTLFAVTFMGTASWGDTVPYVFVNTQSEAVYFEVYNPHTALKDANDQNRTRLFLVQPSTAIVFRDPDFINAGQDATVFYSVPVDVDRTLQKTADTSTGFKAGLSGEVTAKKPGVTATGKAYADFTYQHNTGSTDNLVYATQPVVSVSKLAVNKKWVAREYCTTPFATAKALNEEKWGYVLYITPGGPVHLPKVRPTIDIGMFDPVDYDNNFGRYN